MKKIITKINVFYDGSCGRCRKDRDNYLAIAGKQAKNVTWVDITHKDEHLRDLGIDPIKALKELHIQIEVPNKPLYVVSELDAYIILMNNTLWLKPLAWLIALPLVRPILSKLYHVSVHNRLKKSQRL